jgi:small-conductance mechanosensitive channel
MADVTGVANPATAESFSATLNASRTALEKSFTNAYEQLIYFAPKVVMALVVLVVGYIVARLVAQVFNKLSEKLGLQLAAERSGLAESMRHMGIQRNVPAIVGTIVFWLLMCVFFMAAFNILELTALTAATSAVVNYIPKLLVATVVAVVGLLVASFLRGVIATSADRLGLTYAEHLANASYYVLALLTFILAFNQLGLNYPLLDSLIMIACGGLALGFGLAVGFGGRDVVAGILAGYYLRQRLNSGDQVQVAGMDGIVREVGPVATILETKDRGLIDRHTVPNVKMLNEAVR